MSDEEGEEEEEAPRAPVRRAPRGGDPHLQQSKLSVLSASQRLPKWSFSTAPRFKHTSGEVGKLQGRSKSSPALANASLSTFANTSVSTFADEQVLSPTSARSDDDTLAEPSAGSLAVRTSPARGGPPSWLPNGGKMDANPLLCRSAKAPRMEGSHDRMLSPRQRTGHPRAKSYQPAEGLGHGTSAHFWHAPRYSFGGGKIRVAEEPPSPDKKSKMGQTLKPSEMWVQPRKRRQLSRGFGTEVRLRHRGGALDLPVSPGPAAYEVPRDADPVPVWAPSSLSPWGYRTAGRSEIVNPTATDAGPGEYTANHPFQVAAPSPTFGLHVRELAKDNFPDPTAYDVPTSMGTGVAYGIGPGQRSKWSFGDMPGPGAYSPTLEGVDPHSYHTIFGTVERRHEADEVDPDEPPGPGAHMVRREPKASDKPSVGMPQADSRKYVVGMGPLGVPGPGHYKIELSEGKRMGVHFPLTRSPDKNPGPGEYNPSDHLQRQAAPTPNPLHYTAPRKSPFGQEGSGTEKSSEAILRRCAMEVAKTAEEKGFGVKERKEKSLAFAPSGPSHSFGARRPGPRARNDDCQTMYGAVSSVG